MIKFRLISDWRYAVIITIALINASIGIELGFEYIKANIWSKSIEKVVK